MKTKWLILILALVAVAVVVVLLLRRRASVTTSVQGATSSTAATPAPVTGLAALLAGTPLSGLVNTPIGQTVVNQAASYLPPVAQGWLSNIPQQGPTPPVTALNTLTTNFKLNPEHFQVRF